MSSESVASGRKPTICDLERALRGEGPQPFDILPSGELVTKTAPGIPEVVRDPADEKRWEQIIHWDALADRNYAAADGARKLGAGFDAEESFRDAAACARRFASKLRSQLLQTEES